MHCLSRFWLYPPLACHSTEFRALRALLSEFLGSWDSRRLHHFNLDTSATESVQTLALQVVEAESETPVQTLPDHFNDTVARILRATGVQQNVLPADLHQLLKVWFDLPETIRFAILNWKDIPEDTRRALESMVSQQTELGAQ